jgi:hypothetical protein
MFGLHYTFDDPAGLAPGVPEAMDRYGARVGLNLWLPLLR